MKRREFFTAVGAGAATLLLPARLLIAVLPAIPILYGDGKHDDAVALEAALNGHRVNWSDGRPVGDVISNRHFLCGRTIHIKELRRSLIGNFISVTPEQQAFLSREALL